MITFYLQSKITNEVVWKIKASSRETACEILASNKKITVEELLKIYNVV